MDYLLVALGVVLLYAGGEALVSGSSALARALGMTPLVIGLTVVAFGTSAPELAATLTAALEDSPEVAFGNVIGSNIANVGLILGVAALIFPVAARGHFLRREMPFMIGTSALMLWLVADGSVGRLEALLLLALLGGYLWVLLARQSEEEAQVAWEFAQEYGDGEARVLTSSIKTVVGIILLVLGAKALVTGAVSIARTMGIDERVIGLTLVALGTSLPELASAIVAAVKREGDILLGNVVGSNIFNVLAIFGTTAMVRPMEVEVHDAWSDLTVMMVFSVLLWPMLVSRRHLDRWEGLLLLAGFLGYFGWLFS
jgi:cation:H+ antiporter